MAKKKKFKRIQTTFPENFCGAFRLDIDSNSGSLFICDETGDKVEIWRSGYQTPEEQATQQKFLLGLAEAAKALANTTFQRPE